MDIFVFIVINFNEEIGYFLIVVFLLESNNIAL